jgi:hypothetical protein
MLPFSRSGWLLGRLMVAAGLVVMTVALAASLSEALFLAENQAESAGRHPPGESHTGKLQPTV